MAQYTLDSTRKTLILFNTLVHGLYDQGVAPSEYVGAETYEKLQAAVDRLVPEGEEDFLEDAKELAVDMIRTIIEWAEIADRE